MDGLDGYFPPRWGGWRSAHFDSLGPDEGENSCPWSETCILSLILARCVLGLLDDGQERERHGPAVYDRYALLHHRDSADKKLGYAEDLGPSEKFSTGLSAHPR